MTSDQEQLMRGVAHNLLIGRYDVSAKHGVVIELLRVLVEGERWRTGQLVEWFAKHSLNKRVTRNVVMGLCHRAQPRIKFHNIPGATGVPRRRKPSAVLSNDRHKVRDDRKMPSWPNDRLLRHRCPACGAEPTYKCFGVSCDGQRYGVRLHKERIQLNVTDGGQTVSESQQRRSSAPRCLWAGCGCLPMAPGKPYCEEHHRGSGALPYRSLRSWEDTRRA